MPALDFIRAIIIDISEQSLRECLDFFGEINTETAEVRSTDNVGRKRTPREVATWRGLKFTIFSTGSIHLEGSLHIFFNHGAHNYNDFTLANLYTVLSELYQKTGIKPDNIVLRQLELGVNINVPVTMKVVLDGLFMLRKNPFVWVKNNNEGRYKQAEQDRLYFKVYDKSTHYKSKGFSPPENIGRFEIKWRKMQEFNNLGIHTLQDLLGYGLHNFTDMLVERWEQCLIYDKGIHYPEHLRDKFSNPNHWQELAEHHKKNFDKQRQRLNQIQDNVPNGIRKTVSKLIRTKCHELTQEYPNAQFIYSVHLATPHPTERLCLVTGLNIGMQREDSQLLSHTGIRYYQETDKNVYRELEMKYLTDKWRTADRAIKIREIAHNIRNAYYNPQNSLKRRIERIYEHPVLFDPQPLTNAPYKQ